MRSEERNTETHHSSKVDGHQWVAGQEEVIQPDNMAEVCQHVTEPGDQPTQGKYGAHLRPETQPQVGDTGSSSPHF